METPNFLLLPLVLLLSEAVIVLWLLHKFVLNTRAKVQVFLAIVSLQAVWLIVRGIVLCPMEHIINYMIWVLFVISLTFCSYWAAKWRIR